MNEYVVSCDHWLCFLGIPHGHEARLLFPTLAQR